MNRPSSRAFALFLILCQATVATADEPVSFIADVAPILVSRCVACHGKQKAENGYRVDTFEELQRAGDNELAPVTPGDPGDSELFRLISNEDEDERMPKDASPLSADEIALVKRWIDEGARFDGPDVQAPLVSMLPRVPYPQPPETYTTTVPITAMAFRPDGSELVVGGYHELTVWNPEDGSLVRRISNVAQRTYGLAFSPDGTLLAVGGGEPGQAGEVRLLDPSDGSEKMFLGSAADVVYDIAFRPDGQQLAVASADRTIRIFDVATGKEEQVVENHADWVVAVAWSPDGSKIASASRDKTAKVFNIETGDVTNYAGHGQPVFGVAFAADGNQVFSAGADNKIHLWEIKESKKTAEIAGYGGEVYKIVLAAGHLYSCSADKTAREHKVDDRQQVRSYGDHSDWVYSLAVHPGTKRLATGCFDGQVRVWNLEDGNPIVTFIAAPGKTE